METKRISPFTALQHRNFRLLWIGLLISSIGSQMQLVAVNWHVYLLTKSAVSLGIIGLSRFLPLIIFAPISGMVADMIDRRKLMFFAQITMTLAAVILAATTFNHTISPLLIYLLIAVGSAAMAFDMPSRQSLFPNLVPKKHLVNAISLNTTMFQASVVLGPSLGGFLIAWFGVGYIYIINAFSFIAVIIALLFMHLPQITDQKKSEFDFLSLKEGLRFVIKTPMIISTVLLDFFASFFASATVLMPIFAKDILSVGPKGLGFLYAAPSIGGIAAGLFISTLGHFKHQGKILLGAVLMYGISTILFGISRSFYLSLFFLSLSGIGDTVSTVIRNNIRQLMTPDYLRGRMVSIVMLFYVGGPQLGELEAGLLATAVGTPLSVIIGGIGTIITTLIISILIPRLRKYQGHELLT